MLIALTRPVSPRLGDCELTFLPRVPIDVARARHQHTVYCTTLRALGVAVQTLPAAPDLPDAVFVEDTAVVVDEIAVIARLGAPSRRSEVADVATALAAYRPLGVLRAPAQLDGGDVLRVGRTLYVGTSGRTNAAGVAQLRALLAPYGYQVQPVALHGCLHLKSACTALDATTLLVNDAWVDPAIFAGLRVLRVPPAEPWAANVLAVADQVLLPAGNPATQALLAAHGFAVTPLDISELQKAEAALTCQSILFADPPGAATPAP
ncbi:MAG TPA: arginine deiminase family protein [Chloroflexia bacterium]|nr:arginine deiminase family protein [Chloroflexia bacterium]